MGFTRGVTWCIQLYTALVLPFDVGIVTTTTTTLTLFLFSAAVALLLTGALYGTRNQVREYLHGKEPTRLPLILTYLD